MSGIFEGWTVRSNFTRVWPTLNFEFTITQTRIHWRARLYSADMES